MKSFIHIDTKTMTLSDKAVITMAFTLGGPKLAEIGVDVDILCHDVVLTEDGYKILDGFHWKGDITIGGGLSITMLNIRSVDLTLKQLADAKSILDWSIDGARTTLANVESILRKKL